MSTRRPRRRAAITLAIVALLVAYAAIPRHADLTAFDPAENARIETLMWRHYYDKRFVVLFADLYALARDQDGFAPLDSAPAPVDTEAAARAELDWWQARREQVRPETYGLTIACVTSLVYGVDDDEDVRAFGIVRAQAMEFRDARGRSITEADWTAIERQLLSAYQRLKRAVSRRAKIG